MRLLIIVFVFIGSGVFAQADSKGTIKLKELPVNVKKADTSTIGFDEIVVPDMSSYGQTYDRYPEYVGGDDAMEKFINTTRKYPDCYRCKGNTVGSALTIMINEDGSICQNGILLN